MKDTSWIDRREYPFDDRYFDVPAGRLHYVDEGTGSPIVMVHGNPTWSFLYRNLIKRLRSRYRCIAVDHLGFGLSDKPRRWSYLPKDHANNLSALIEGLGIANLTLVLHDWGGPIGLSYAVAHPERVARIVLMNTWCWPLRHDLRLLVFSRVMGGAVGRLLIRRYNFFARVLLPLAFEDGDELSAIAHSHYLRPLKMAEDRKGCAVFPKQITASSAWLAELSSRLSVLDAKPKLFVWGMKDVAFRERELRRWERTFPAARSARLPNAGHFVPEEASDDLASAVMSFLAATEET